MSNLIDNKDQGSDDLTYEELVSNVEIETINVRRLNLESFIQPHKVKDYLHGDNSIEVDIRDEFKLEISNDEEDTFVAIGLIQVSARIEEDIIFLVDVELAATYDTTNINGVIHSELYEKFVNQNVPVNLWPYARELIQTGTTRMGYPPLVIRPYRVLI